MERYFTPVRGSSEDEVKMYKNSHHLPHQHPHYHPLNHHYQHGSHRYVLKLCLEDMCQCCYY